MALQFSKEHPASGAEFDPKDDISDVVSSIASLREEASQLDELSELEREYSKEVISQLKGMLESLNASFRIPPASITKSDTSLTDVILTAQCSLCLIRNENTTTRALESVKTETLLAVVKQVAPQIRSLAVERRMRMAERVTMLERVTKEFMKLRTASAEPSPMPSAASRSQQTFRTARATDSMFQGSVPQPTVPRGAPVQTVNNFNNAPIPSRVNSGQARRAPSAVQAAAEPAPRYRQGPENEVLPDVPVNKKNREVYGSRRGESLASELKEDDSTPKIDLLAEMKRQGESITSLSEQIISLQVTLENQISETEKRLTASFDSKLVSTVENSARGQKSAPPVQQITLRSEPAEEAVISPKKYDEPERAESNELASQLKSMIEPFNASFHIAPASLTKSDTSITDIILTPEGSLQVARGDNVTTKNLENLKSETLQKIIREVAPQVRSLALDRRQRMAERVAMLERKTGAPSSEASPKSQRGMDSIFEEPVLQKIASEDDSVQSSDPVLYPKKYDGTTSRVVAFQN
jgi:hypothetical protein